MIEGKDEGCHKSFAIELVHKGAVVFAPELVGFGDRKLKDDQGVGSPGDNSCYMIASQLLLMGKTLAGLRIQECRRRSEERRVGKECKSRWRPHQRKEEER